MDPDDRPSTSKKYMSKLRTSTPEANAMYPATFEQFIKYTKVEDYVIKEMKNAGPDIYKINYKIRHKYYPIVYKKFYSNEATRKQMFQNGFELKPMPKFLKDKLMTMPTGDVKLPTAPDTSNKNKGASSLSKRIEQINRKQSPKAEKDNCPENIQKSPKKDTPKAAKSKDKVLNVEMRKITTFFNALKSPASKISEQDVRKRKTDLSSSSAEPIIKRLRNARPKNKTIPKSVQNISKDKRKSQLKAGDTAKSKKLPSDLISDDASSNVQIMVKVPVPISTELSCEIMTPKLPIVNEPSRKEEPRNNNHRQIGTTNRNERKGTKSVPRNRGIPSVNSSDDTDIESSKVVDDPGSLDSDVLRVSEEICVTPEKSPLPRRNRMENFEQRSSSLLTKNLQNDPDPGMTLFNLSERSSPSFNLSSVVGVEGVAQFEGNVAAKEIEFPQEDFICVDRLEAIRTYPAKVRAYIKHLLNLEIEKTREKASKASSRTKVVSAFLQMSFEEYKCLVNANRLLQYGTLADNVTTSLNKQYESIVNKQKPWLKGVYVKLPTLIAFLQSKGISQPMQLQHIPPRILSFIDVMANTNLKEYVSFSGEKPPDSNKLLLHLCKKEYQKCCEDGIWSDGIHFNDTTLNEMINADSIPLLNVESSGVEVNARVPCEEGQSAVRRQKSMQLGQVAMVMVKNESEQPDRSKPNSPLKKKKKRIINSFQSDQVIEDYLDAMFEESDFEPEATQCSAIIDNAVTPTLVADIDKLTVPPIDIALVTAPTEALILASPKRSLALREPEQIPEETNTHTFSENALALKESEQVVEDVNVPAEAAASVEMLAPEPLPALSEESGGITIADTPESAGQLLSDIIHPKVMHNKSADLIPPSPNLFQSSGESQINCTQSLDINARPTETVYVPCKHSHTYSMTYNTEQNNLTVCVDPASDSEDPFVETINNQEDNIMTQLPSLDTGLVVKQELLSQRDVLNKNCDKSLDDSLEIIEVPPSEPYVIEDSPDMTQLLNILTNLTTKRDETELSTRVNRLNHNNEHSEPLIAQGQVQKAVESEAVSEELYSELPDTKVFIPLPRNIEGSPQHIVPDEDFEDFSLEVIDVPSPEPIVIDDEETAPELLDMLLRRPTKTTIPNRDDVNLNPCDPSFSCVDNFPQAQHFPSHLSFTQSQSNAELCHDVPSSPQGEETQNDDENEGTPQVEIDFDKQTQNEETDISITVIEEILASGSSEAVSHVSIAPQRFPSDIDFNQSGSNDPSKEACDRGASQTANQLSTHQSDDDESMISVYVALCSGDTEETSKGDQSIEATAMSISCSEAELPGSGGDSSSNSIQNQNLDLLTASHRGIFQALELPTYGDEEMSSVAAEGTCLQEPDIDAAPENKPKSAMDDDSYKSSEGELFDVDEDDTDDQNPQESCVSEDQPKGDCEASDRQKSKQISDQVGNIETLGFIQQCHTSQATTNATPVPLTLTIESKAVEPAKAFPESNTKAPSSDQLNPSLSLEVGLPQHREDCESSVPSLIKETDPCTKYLPEAERYESLQAEGVTKKDQSLKVVANPYVGNLQDVNAATKDLPEAERYQFQHITEDKTKEDESSTVAVNALVADPQDAVSCRQKQQNHVPYAVAVESKVLAENAEAAFENQFQNVRISRGTHRSRVLKNDAQKDEIASSGKNQETMSSEHNRNAVNRQSDLNAEKPTSSTDFQETKTTNWCDAGPIRDDSKNVMLSSASEDSLPAEVFTLSTQQIEPMEIIDEDEVPRDTFCYICPLPDDLEVTVATNVNQHANEATNSQIPGDNLGSGMEKNCISETHPRLSHPMVTSSAMEQDPQIPASSAQSTLDYVASKSRETTVVNQITSITLQQTESSIWPHVIGNENSTKVTDAAKSATQKNYTFPALLPIGIIPSERPEEIIEGETVLDDDDEEEFVVPLLIKGRFLKSLPFKMLSQAQVQLHWERSQFLGIEVKFETTFVEPVEVAVEKETLNPHSEVTNASLAENTTNQTKTETKDPKKCRISAAKKISPRSRQVLQKCNITSTFSVPESSVSIHGAQTMRPKTVRVDRESEISAQPKSTQPPSKPKPSPTSKKKATPKKSTKKPAPELVPQKVHSFRSLPMGAVKKPLSSATPTTRAPLTTVEEIDFFIEDASQVIACSNTASQLLATDCTYFENSKLLNNVDAYCAQQPSTSKPGPPQERTNPKVNKLIPPIILSDGITARKVWKVHLQWTAQGKMIAETRFITGGRWLSSYDESAKLMFHFLPTTWSHIFRVLKEIDHYEYRRMAAMERKHCPVVTPLHRVLRFLFDTAPQIVNVRLTNDTHSPFTMCERSSPLYRKPFQCLTKGLPARVLDRMKSLKRDLRAANPDV